MNRIQYYKCRLIFVAAGLTACASDVGNQGVTVRTPSIDNRFTGVFSTEAIGHATSFTPRAVQLCSDLGGLASGPTYIDTGPFTRFFQYQCNGRAAANEKTTEARDTGSPSKTKDQDTNSDPRKSLESESQNTITLKPETPGNRSTNSRDRLSIEAAKKKCTGLGFKPSTEGHGRCVLQLSR